MEKKIIDILVDMQLDIRGIKADVSEIKGRVGNLESDMAEVKSTTRSLANALLETSREVKHLKAAK